MVAMGLGGGASCKTDASQQCNHIRSKAVSDEEVSFSKGYSWMTKCHHGNKSHHGNRRKGGEWWLTDACQVNTTAYPQVSRCWQALADLKNNDKSKVNIGPRGIPKTLVSLLKLNSEVPWNKFICSKTFCQVVWFSCLKISHCITVSVFTVIYLYYYAHTNLNVVLYVTSDHLKVFILGMEGP